MSSLHKTNLKTNLASNSTVLKNDLFRNAMTKLTTNMNLLLIETESQREIFIFVSSRMRFR